MISWLADHWVGLVAVGALFEAAWARSAANEANRRIESLHRQVDRLHDHLLKLMARHGVSPLEQP